MQKADTKTNVFWALMRTICYNSRFYKYATHIQKDTTNATTLLCDIGFYIYKNYIFQLSKGHYAMLCAIVYESTLCHR